MLVYRLIINYLFTNTAYCSNYLSNVLILNAIKVTSICIFVFFLSLCLPFPFSDIFLLLCLLLILSIIFNFLIIRIIHYCSIFNDFSAKVIDCLRSNLPIVYDQIYCNKILTICNGCCNVFKLKVILKLWPLILNFMCVTVKYDVWSKSFLFKIFNFSFGLLFNIGIFKCINS